MVTLPAFAVSRTALLVSLSLLLSGVSSGVAAAPQKPDPTQADVRYGPHERNVLDFWKAKSSSPTPLVVYVHGGGFRQGSKESLDEQILDELLRAGVSVVAIHYRFVRDAPLPAAQHDAMRALQFLRSKAGEWNIDKSRVGAFGGSAGAQICMWLAFHDDMAEAGSADPVGRESSRLLCVATHGGQTTRDMKWWVKHIPGYDGPHRSREEYYGDIPDDTHGAIVRYTSALASISADDPPIFMNYVMAPDDPIPADPDRARSWKAHHVIFGIELKRRMDALGVEAHLNYPGAEPQYVSMSEFFIAKLKTGGPQTARQ